MTQSLTDLTLILAAVGFETRILHRNEENPIEQSVVALDQLELQLYDPTAVYAETPEYQALAGPAEGLGALMFYWQSELILNRERSLDTYQLLAFLNQLLPLGNYDYNLDDSTISFRYALPLESGQADPELVAQILEKLSFYLTRMTPAIEMLHTTDATLADVLEYTLDQLG